MGSEVIKSFLVGLGFGVDDASLAKFNKAIDSAALRVTALYGTINAAATGIVFGISKISESFEDLGYEFHLVAPAINKALLLRQELLKAYGAAGINITRVIQNSIKLNLSLTKTKYAFEAIYKSVGSRFFGLLTKQSDIFRNKLYANMPKIQAALEKFVNFIFKAFEAVTTLGERAWSILQRIYDFFVKLDKATDGWSTIILGLVAAWKFLNLSFLATPLGMLLAGFTALLALWDDFKTFREGGQSLINWGSEMSRILVGIAAGVALVTTGLYAGKLAFAAYTGIMSIAQGALALFNGELTIMDGLLAIAEAPFWAIAAAIGAIVAGLTLADSKFNIFGGHLASFFSGIGGKVMDFLAGGPMTTANPNFPANAQNVAANLQNNPVTQPVGLPAGVSNTQNSNTNQNVNQQTNINIQGSADAQSIGKSVASQQSRVNFDMVRNMKSPTR